MKWIFRKKHYHHGDIYDKMSAAEATDDRTVYFSCGDRCYEETALTPQVLSSARVTVVNLSSRSAVHLTLPYACFECREANNGKPIPAAELTTGASLVFDACDCTVAMAKWDRAIGWMYKLRGTFTGDVICSRGSEWIPESVIFRRGWR